MNVMMPVMSVFDIITTVAQIASIFKKAWERKMGKKMESCCISEPSAVPKASLAIPKSKISLPPASTQPTPETLQCKPSTVRKFLGWCPDLLWQDVVGSTLQRGRKTTTPSLLDQLSRLRGRDAQIEHSSMVNHQVKQAREKQH